MKYPEKIPSENHSKIKKSNLTIRVNYSLAEKLEGRISFIKIKKNHSFSKQQWIVDAIREKLASDKRLLKKAQFPKKGKIDKRLNCSIDENLLQLLNEHLDHIQKSCDITTSKNSWIAQAINEKLEKET